MYTHNILVTLTSSASTPKPADVTQPPAPASCLQCLNFQFAPNCASQPSTLLNLNSGPTAMTNHRALTFLYGVLVLIATSVVSARLERLSSLPVIFFHGITGNRHNGDRYVANLTAEGRTAIALSFCEDACSTQSLREQVPLAIQQVRDIVRHDSAFKNGYIFIGHSQGGQLSRSVIELMDDHKDAALAASNSAFNDRITSGMFNFSSYPGTDYMNGQVQYDLHKHILLNPQLHYQYAMANHARTPVHAAWAASNPHLPLVNNVNPCAVHDDACEKDKARRKANFLKLPAAHFFGSPDDGIVTPWQSSLLGQNSEVDALDDIVSGFQDFTIVNMTATREYINDTYGLQTLDKRGGLFLHEVPSVTHACWIYDDAGCEFQTVYDRYIYPLLH